MSSAFIASLFFAFSLLFSLSDGAIIYSSGDNDLALPENIISVADFIF
jgi:hypothetical protein